MQFSGYGVYVLVQQTACAWEHDMCIYRYMNGRKRSCMCMWVSTFTHTSACLTPLCTFYFNVLYSKHGRPQKFPQSRLGQYLVANPAWPRIQCIQHMQVQLLEGVCGAGLGKNWLPTLHGPEISAFSTCRYNSLKEYVGQVGAVPQ